MAKINDIKSYTVGVSNIDNENREFNLKANARVEEGRLTMLDCGEIHSLPVPGGNPEGDPIGGFTFYEGGASVSTSGTLTLSRACALAEAFRDEIRDELQAAATPEVAAPAENAEAPAAEV